MSSEERLSEVDVRNLLKRNEVAVPMSAAQRERLRQRVPALQDPDSVPLADDISRIENGERMLDISVGTPRRSFVRRRQVLAAVAALAALGAVSSMFLLGPNRSDGDRLKIADEQVVIFPTAAPTAEAPAIAFCRDAYGPLLEGVEAWGDVDTWIFLLDRRLPQPDLAFLAQHAVAEVDQLVDDPALEDLAARLGELRDGFVPAGDTAAPQGWSRGEIEAHRSAVNESLELLGRLVAAEGWAIHPGCSR